MTTIDLVIIITTISMMTTDKYKSLSFSKYNKMPQ